MNTKILRSVALMAVGAFAVRGIGGLAPSTVNPKLVHGLLAGASALGAMKINNPDLQSALMGATVVKSLDLGKSIFESTSAAANLQTKTDKASAFLRGATGLGCPCDDGLGYANEEMAYLNGASEMYIDEAGNVIGLGFPEDSEEYYLNGAEEEEYYLNGAEDELAYLNGAEEELSVL